MSIQELGQKLKTLTDVEVEEARLEILYNLFVTSLLGRCNLKDFSEPQTKELDALFLIAMVEDIKRETSGGSAVKSIKEGDIAVEFAVTESGGVAGTSVSNAARLDSFVARNRRLKRDIYGEKRG